MARCVTQRRGAYNTCIQRDHDRRPGAMGAADPPHHPSGPGVGEARPVRRVLALATTAALGLSVAVGTATYPVRADTGTTGAPTVSAGTPSASAVVATVEQYIGYPYATVGDEPSTGFSCIGLVHFVFAQNGVDVPENLSQAYASAPQVDQTSLQPGDLVFFQNTVWAGISHVDIYVGAGKMIGADSAQTGVQWDTLADAYWQQHYLGATRPLSTSTGTPVDPSATIAPAGTPVNSPPTGTPSLPTATPTPTGMPNSSMATPVPSVAALSSATGPSLSVTTGMTVTTWRNAPVYARPGDRDALPIDVVASFVPLTVTQTDGAWVNVSYDSGTQDGWVRGSDLTLHATAASGSGSDSGSAGRSGPNGRTGSTANSRGATSPTTTDHSATRATRVVQEASATVDTSPSTDSAVVVTLTPGTHVVVLQTQGPWDGIVLPDGTVGWIADSALAPTLIGGAGTGTSGTSQRGGTPHVQEGLSGGSYDTRASSAMRSRAVVTADVLFVRANPDPLARILRRVHAGDRLAILATTHGWDYVSQRDGARGWVSAQWIDVTENVRA